jgi:hypothetical protein
MHTGTLRERDLALTTNEIVRGRLEKTQLVKLRAFARYLLRVACSLRRIIVFYDGIYCACHRKGVEIFIILLRVYLEFGHGLRRSIV